MKTAKGDRTKLRHASSTPVLRGYSRCTHRRVPGSRLVGAGDADVVVVRCSLKNIFFVTLLANKLGEEQTEQQDAAFFPKYGTVIS